MTSLEPHEQYGSLNLYYKEADEKRAAQLQLDAMAAFAEAEVCQRRVPRPPRPMLFNSTPSKVSV
jgi:hypothetical protein